jgi:hypothetical protein
VRVLSAHATTKNLSAGISWLTFLLQSSGITTMQTGVNSGACALLGNR